MKTPHQNTQSKDIETHPLPPFVMANAKVLFLGSFPPPKIRWKMDFYYPNFNNDFWRIMGVVFFDNKNKFINVQDKTFYQADIEHFLINKGIAISDSAYQVRRLQDNASDKFLQIITPMDIKAILKHLPYCTTLIATGEKSAQILCQEFAANVPKVGKSVHLTIGDRMITLYRAPSSSRAYPLSLEQKANIYRQILQGVVG